eukprot:1059099-Alexandrium_andersonii.AAC.1
MFYEGAGYDQRSGLVAESSDGASGNHSHAETRPYCELGPLTAGEKKLNNGKIKWITNDTFRTLMERKALTMEGIQQFFVATERIDVQLGGDLLRLCERLARWLGIGMSAVCAAVWCLPLRHPDGDPRHAQRRGGSRRSQARDA